MGRASRQSAVEAYKKLEPAGSKWHIHGWFCLAGCYLLMMFYTSVSGWMLDYFFKFLTGTFAGLDTQAVGGVFSDMLANPFEVGPWMAVTVIVGFAFSASFFSFVSGFKKVRCSSANFSNNPRSSGACAAPYRLRNASSF